MTLIFQNIWLFFGLCACCYALGSVNTAIVFLRLLGKSDPRATGSGNPGATNVLRTAGAKVGAAVLVFDLTKAYASIWLGRALGLGDAAALLALPYLLGNLFPAFHGLRGGKGVAASVGCMFAISPMAMVIGGMVFLAVVAITKFVSLGSLFMLLTTALWIWLSSEEASNITQIVSGMFILVAVFTHRHNIRRLAHGKEPRLSWTKGENARHSHPKTTQP